MEENSDNKVLTRQRANQIKIPTPGGPLVRPLYFSSDACASTFSPVPILFSDGGENRIHPT